MTQEHHSGLERMVESTGAKAFTRFVVPLMLAMIGWFCLDTLGGIRKTQDSQGETIRKQGESLAEVSTGLQVLNAKIDYSVIHQLQQMDRRITQLEAARTP